MATTAKDICRRALMRIQILAAGEDMSDSDAVDTLAAFNEMMNGLKADGIDVWWVNMEPADEFRLGDEYLLGVTAMLAVHVSPDYGRDPPLQVATDAINGRMQLSAAFSAPDTPKVDRGLPMGWSRSRGYLAW